MCLASCRPGEQHKNTVHIYVVYFTTGALHILHLHCTALQASKQVSATCEVHINGLYVLDILLPHLGEVTLNALGTPM